MQDHPLFASKTVIDAAKIVNNSILFFKTMLFDEIYITPFKKQGFQSENDKRIWGELIPAE